MKTMGGGDNHSEEQELYIYNKLVVVVNGKDKHVLKRVDILRMNGWDLSGEMRMDWKRVNMILGRYFES